MSPHQQPKLDSLASEPLPVPDGTSASAPIRKDVELGYDRTDIAEDIAKEDQGRRSSVAGFAEKGKGKEKEHGKGLTEGDAGLLGIINAEHPS
jgi:hypothetical protein